MLFLNEHEIDAAVSQLAPNTVSGRAARFLQEFKNEVNEHSDGWPYWRPPVQSARQLMELVQTAVRLSAGDIQETAFKRALAPIRAFYTRRGNAAGMKFPEL